MYLPGDTIEVHKGIFRHPGIYVGFNNVFHNHPSSGEAIVDLTTYDPKGISVLRCRPHSTHVPVILNRINQIMQNPESYSPFTNNCEDSVSKVLTGKAGSPQREGWALFTVIAALTAAALR